MRPPSIRSIALCYFLAIISSIALAQSVTISPSNPSGIIDAATTTKGVLPPRMTTAQRNALTAVSGLQVYCTDCSPSGPYSYNGSSWVAMFQTSPGSSTTYTIGQSAQGGIVFWVDATGEHGLVAATSDQTTSAKWANINYITTMAIRSGAYGGAINTELINNAQRNGLYAASIASTHNGGSFGDWYLPSALELNLMYTQRVTLGMSATSYWSSTEAMPAADLTSESAVALDFSSGIASEQSKMSTYRVRAIRRF
ncbi:MAG: hypothetical protein ACK4NY_04080 [Spirosomataceae bacterium]